MSEPDQCIICLDTLPKLLPSAAAAGGADAVTVTDQVPPATAAAPREAQNTTTTFSTGNDEPNHLNLIAALDGCDHIIHDACIRSWAQKTNTCPICRNEFHQVRVYNGLDGKSQTNSSITQALHSQSTHGLIAYEIRKIKLTLLSLF